MTKAARTELLPVSCTFPFRQFIVVWIAKVPKMTALEFLISIAEASKNRKRAVDAGQGAGPALPHRRCGAHST